MYDAKETNRRTLQAIEYSILSRLEQITKLIEIAVSE